MENMIIDSTLVRAIQVRQAHLRLVVVKQVKL